MKHLAAALLCAGLAVGSTAVPARATQATNQPATQGNITINDPAERDAFLAIEKAATPADAIAAAKAALAKYPQSAGKVYAETQLYGKVYDQLKATPDQPTNAQLIADFEALFPGSEQALRLRRLTVDHLISRKSFGEVYKVGDLWLAKYPDDPTMHFVLLQIAIEALRGGDASKLQAGLGHGERAIALMEAGTKGPQQAETDFQTWKSRSEAVANQQTGLLALQTGDGAKASKYLSRAITLSPKDPLNYFFLGALKESAYETVAKRYTAMPDAEKKSPAGQKTLAEAQAMQDEIIGLLVKSIAYAMDDPQYGPLMAQARPTLEAHFKSRKGSLDGLDAAIQAAKTQ